VGSTNPIRITTTVNVAPLKAGMDEAAGIVQTSTSQMSASFQKADEISSAAIAEMRAQIEGLQLQLTQLNSKIDEVPVHAASSFGEARGSARLLSEEMGIHMNRELSKVLAQSSLLGPALSAAFSVIAVGAFIGIAVQVADKLSTWISDALIYTKAMKEAYDQDVAYSKANNELVDSQKKAGEEQIKISREIALIGKTPLEASRMKAEWDKEALGYSQAGLAIAQQTATADQAKLQSLIAQKALEEAKPQNRMKATGRGEEMVPSDAKAKVAELDEEITKLERAMDSDRRAAAELATGMKGVGVAAMDAAKSAREAAQAWLDSPLGRAGFNESGALSYDATIKKLGQTFQTTFSVDGPLAGIKMASEGINDADRAMMTAAPVLTNTWDVMADKAKKAYEAIQKAAEEAARGTIAGAKQAEESAVEQAEHLVKMHLMTDDQLTKLKLAQVAKEQEIDLQALNAELNTLGPQEIEKRAQINAQIENLQRQHQRTMTQIDQQGELQRAQLLQSDLTKMTGMFNEGFSKWLGGQEKFSKAMIQVWSHMAQQFMMNLLKMAEQELIAAATHKTVAAQQIMVDAKKGAADAYQALSAIPIIGPALGAAAAAVTFAGIMAFATFDKGGIADTDMIGQLHAEEMVLDPKLSQFVQRSAAQASGQEEGGGGDMHLHVQATDAASVSKMFEKQSGQIRRQMKSMSRGVIGGRKGSR
jgi:hypothetical protein